MLMYAAVFLGLAIYSTVRVVRRIETRYAEQLTMGFVYGLGLAVVWTTFGLIGALCLGKFLAGFQNDFLAQELLIRYHDRLRELGTCWRTKPVADERGGATEPSARKPHYFTADGQTASLPSHSPKVFVPRLAFGSPPSSRPSSPTE